VLPGNEIAAFGPGCHFLACSELSARRSRCSGQSRNSLHSVPDVAGRCVAILLQLISQLGRLTPPAGTRGQTPFPRGSAALGLRKAREALAVLRKRCQSPHLRRPAIQPRPVSFVCSPSLPLLSQREEGTLFPHASPGGLDTNAVTVPEPSGLVVGGAARKAGRPARGRLHSAPRLSLAARAWFNLQRLSLALGSQPPAAPRLSVFR
jgi:hypothetical protein